MTDEELKRLFERLRQENAAVADETRRHFDETAKRQTAETRQYFDVAAEATRADIRLMAEALSHSEERLDRRIGQLEENVERGFADTQAMIKFSHAELARRVRTLEEAP